MSNFATLLYTPTCEIPTLLYIWSLKKGTPSGLSLPVQAIIGNTFPGSSFTSSHYSNLKFFFSLFLKFFSKIHEIPVPSLPLPKKSLGTGLCLSMIVTKTAVASKKSNEGIINDVWKESSSLGWRGDILLLRDYIGMCNIKGYVELVSPN